MVRIFLPVSFFFSLFLSHHPADQSGEKEYMREENRSKAYDALTFLTAMRAFPHADIPADAYAKGWERHKEIAKAATTRTAWESLGPNNIGGRTISIAIDPTDTSVIWLGAASGGLWKSTTGGIGIGAWEYVPTGFPVLGVGAIAINPSDHNEMYIGTGETYAYGYSTNGLVDRTQRGCFGIGILKTTDGGATWSHSLDWLYQDNRGVWDILYHPDNTQVLYAATTEGVYKTTDGGSTWANVLDRKMVMDIMLDPTNPDVVYAGVGNEDSDDKGIYKTTDGGANWVILTNGLPSNNHDGRITLAMYDQNPNILMAIIGNRYSTVGTYRSTDAGNSWTLKTAMDIMQWQGWFCKGLLMKSNDSSKVMAGGVYIYKSNNSGGNFVSSGAVHSDIHDVISNPLDANKIYVISDGGLYRSNNFGGNYYDCYDGYVSSQHYIGSVSAQDPTVGLSGLQDNSTIKYYGSEYWYGVIGGDGCYNAIDPADDFNQFGCYQYLNIYRSDDQGNNFNLVHSEPSDPNGGNPAAFMAPLAMSQSNPSVLYAGSSTLLKTTNTGTSWTEVQPDPLDNGNSLLSIGISLNHPDTVYFATAPTDAFPFHIYRSFDGGYTKTDITSGLPNRYLRRITVHPHNANIVYATFSGFHGVPGGHIYKSEDAGSTWQDISTTLPDIPFHCLTIDPDFPSNLYAGCDFTVYVSSDGGVNWFTYDEGFPDALMVFDLVISPADNSILAFTHGNGVYKNELLNDAVDVDEVEESADVSVFPNPASDYLIVDFGSFREGVTATLLDHSGKVVKVRKLFSTQKCSWYLADLPEGTYLLHLKGNSLNQTRKITVVH